MKHIFSLERILIHNENMDFTGEQIRIKIFGYAVVNYCLPQKLNTI